MFEQYIDPPTEPKEPPDIYVLCSTCGEEIHEGYDRYNIDDNIYCEHCIHDWLHKHCTDTAGEQYSNWREYIQ